MRKRSTLEEDSLVAQASEWFAHLSESNVGQSANDAFASWLLHSPDHIESFLDVSTVAGEIGLAKNLPSAEVLIEAARAEDVQTNVYQLTTLGRVSTLGRMPERNTSFGRVAGLAAAAAIVVAAFLLGWHSFVSSPERTRLQTQIGEQRSVILDDGSVVALNTNSELSVELSEESRNVALNRGEVRFTVKKDPKRPFVVTTPQAIIRVLGTVFNVHISGGDTIVTVFEGHVDVMEREDSSGSARVENPAEDGAEPKKRRSRIVLHAGEQIAISASGRLHADSGGSFERAAAWQSRQMSFRDETLEQLVNEFNRYHKQAIRIEDRELASHRVDGMFDPFDHPSLLSYLERYEGVAVERQPNGDIVLRRAGAPRANAGQGAGRR